MISHKSAIFTTHTNSNSCRKFYHNYSPAQQVVFQLRHSPITTSYAHVHLIYWSSSHAWTYSYPKTVLLAQAHISDPFPILVSIGPRYNIYHAVFYTTASPYTKNRVLGMHPSYSYFFNIIKLLFSHDKVFVIPFCMC